MAPNPSRALFAPCRAPEGLPGPPTRLPLVGGGAPEAPLEGPASYRGIFLNDTLAKLFEGLLIARPTTHTELLNTLTDSQLGTKPDTQTHDAIYSLFAIIQHNKYTLDKPTFVAFVDYSTAYPSVHRDGISSNLLKNDIRGNMWYHLRARYDKIKLRVLHPGISARHTVDILRGLPKGSRLSPTLFGIFVADLVHELRAKFPHAVIYPGRHPPNQHTLSPSTTHIWIGEPLYVDDPALMSTCPRKLQTMLHACKQWSIRNRMRINTDKTKIMAFFETPALLRARGGQHQPGPTMPPFHVYSPFPTSDPHSYPIHEVFQFEYLGLVLGPLKQPDHNSTAFTSSLGVKLSTCHVLFSFFFVIFLEIGHPQFFKLFPFCLDVILGVFCCCVGNPHLFPDLGVQHFFRLFVPAIFSPFILRSDIPCFPFFPHFFLNRTRFSASPKKFVSKYLGITLLEIVDAHPLFRL